MVKNRRSRQFLEPLPTSLLDQPLDYVLADHLRQRVLCVLCDQIADSTEVDPEIAAEVVAFMTRDLVVHVIDEEQDLFPMIRRRATPEDAIEPVLGQLSGDHAEDEALANTIIAGLQAIRGVSPPKPPKDLRKALRRFAESQRQHLALENATLMPLAKRRLTPQDLTELSVRMATRRGIVPDDGG